MAATTTYSKYAEIYKHRTKSQDARVIMICWVIYTFYRFWKSTTTDNSNLTHHWEEMRAILLTGTRQQWGMHSNTWSRQRIKTPTWAFSRSNSSVSPLAASRFKDLPKLSTRCKRRWVNKRKKSWISAVSSNFCRAIPMHKRKTHRISRINWKPSTTDWTRCYSPVLSSSLTQISTLCNPNHQPQPWTWGR